MNPQIVIRNETDADTDAIAEVTISAFRTLVVSDQTEQSIIETRRHAQALAVSLAAEVDGHGVEHIASSPNPHRTVTQRVRESALTTPLYCSRSI